MYTIFNEVSLILQLEQKLTEVEQFYSGSSKKQLNNPKVNSIGKDKDRERFLAGFKKRQQDAARREAAAAKRMQELMRKCGPILSTVKIISANCICFVYLFVCGTFLVNSSISMYLTEN